MDKPKTNIFPGLIYDLVFATRNNNKIQEVSSIWREEILDRGYHLRFPQIKSLEDINLDLDMEETGIDLQENAILKANYIYSNHSLNCFAEDSGLEVEELGGAPGVYSARFAGPECDDLKNISLLLRKLEKKDNRRARFKTAIALIIDGKTYLFFGSVNGYITSEIRGENGFGYDPVFQPEGCLNTFAEMDLSTKNNMSHRSIAIRKMVRFLIPLLPKIDDN